MRLVRTIPLLVAVGTPLAACNATGTVGPRAIEPADAVSEPEATDYSPLDRFDVGANAVEVSENLCGCGDPEERYVFAITRPDGTGEVVTLVHSEALTRAAHDADAILADQTLWYLERTAEDGAVDPIVYFNFEPTYDEAETLLVAYLSGDERYASVMGGGWVRESNSDPRPDPLQWSHIYGVFQATRYEE